LVALWLESQFNNNNSKDADSFVIEKLNKFKHDKVLGQLNKIIENHPDIALESVSRLVETASIDKVKEVIAILNEKLNSVLSNKPSNNNQANSTFSNTIETPNTSPASSVIKDNETVNKTSTPASAIRK
jgi:hypothetical protein